MKRELEDAKILGPYFFLKALQGKALHKEAKVNYEMMELELQKVLLDVEALSKKRTTSDLHYVR
jgi:hypothetical protein